MSKEQDKYIMQNLYNKLMPLYVANTMCEAQAYQYRERGKDKTPYKQERNKDRNITQKRRQLKKIKKKNRK